MDKKYLYALTALLAILIVIVISVPVFINGEKPSENIRINNGIIRSIDFDISSGSEGQNTSATGTVFISGEGETPEKISIVARIEIDPEDSGGVVFDIPPGWKVSAVTSSYPENYGQTKPGDYASIWTTTDPEPEWNTMVEIGRDHGNLPAGSGTGTVVIDLVPDENAIPDDAATGIMVEVGSDEKDGIRIWGTDYVEIPLYLTGEE